MSQAPSPIAQAFPIVRRALKILADREVSPQTGLLKSTLLQLDSTFSERTYGASSFLDFVEKLAQTGLVQLKQAGRSVMVELQETAAGNGSEPSPAPPETGAAVVEGAFGAPVSEVPPASVEPAANGVKRAGEILSAAVHARWPMYLRNVKQLLRAADEGFDERRYGFSGLVEFVRACQKEGLVRLERDRRGGLRVFPGAALHHPIAPREEPTEAPPPQPIEMPPDEAVGALAVGEPEPLDAEPMPIVDPTAELLGTKARRRPRSSGGPAGRRLQKGGTARTPAAPARRSTRSKKTAPVDEPTG